MQRFGQRDAVADGGALAVRRDDVDVAEVLDRFVEGVDAGRLDAIVVAQEDTHSLGMMAEARRDGKRGVAAAGQIPPGACARLAAARRFFHAVEKLRPFFPHCGKKFGD